MSPSDGSNLSGMQKPSVRCSGVEAPGGRGVGWGAVCSWEVGRKEAERLVLVGGQRRAVALVGAWDAAAGGARAVAEGLDAALPLQLWGGGGKKIKSQIRRLQHDNKHDSTVGSESSVRSALS